MFIRRIWTARRDPDAGSPGRVSAALLDIAENCADAVLLHQIEELSLTLPLGRDIELLPSGKTIENPYLRYESSWQRDGQTVTVRREITVKLPVAVCRDEIRAQLVEAIAEIRGDYRSEITLKPLVH